MREAQRLADKLIEEADYDIHHEAKSCMQESARELRRLDAREAELLALLRQANTLLMENRDDVERIEPARYMRDPVLVAIKTATGETK